MIKLTNRLKTAAGFVRADRVTADVGTEIDRMGGCVEKMQICTVRVVDKQQRAMSVTDLCK